jgi:hypothetical protein
MEEMRCWFWFFVGMLGGGGNSELVEAFGALAVAGKFCLLSGFRSDSEKQKR